MTLIAIYMAYLLFLDPQLYYLPTWRRVCLYITVELPYISLIFLVMKKIIKL